MLLLKSSAKKVKKSSKKAKADTYTLKSCEISTWAVEYGYADAEAVRNAAEEDELRKLALVRIVSEWVAESCVQVAK